jgi:CRISPR-associated exonuclease Cas4
MHAFRDLETAAYCPRKLYYRRREPDADREPPAEVRERRALAFAYERLLDSKPARKAAPLAVAPATFRDRLRAARDRLDCWPELVDPADREVLATGREARGVVHKVLTDPLRPAMVFTGQPPEQGVWNPQSVRLVAAAKALAYTHETPVEDAIAEYPTYGVVRRIDLTTRRKAAYRSAIRTADRIDGPPSRVDNDAKCQPCEFRTQCGTRTRSLRSLLGR